MNKFVEEKEGLDWEHIGHQIIIIRKKLFIFDKYYICVPALVTPGLLNSIDSKSFFYRLGPPKLRISLQIKT